MGGAIVVVICIIASLIWGIRAGKKRRDDMTLLTEKLGLQFNHDRNYQFADRFSFLDKLRQGSNQYAYTILSGTFQEHEVTAFNFHDETYSIDSNERQQTHHHHFSFFTLELEHCFPELTIANERFFSKMIQADGYNDIDFEPHEFSKKFIVRSKDKTFAHDFCTAPLIEYLLSHPDINIEVSQNTLALGFDSSLSIEEIEPYLTQLIAIRSLMSRSFGS